MKETDRLTHSLNQTDRQADSHTNGQTDRQTRWFLKPVSLARLVLKLDSLVTMVLNPASLVPRQGIPKTFVFSTLSFVPRVVPFVPFVPLCACWFCY